MQKQLIKTPFLGVSRSFKVVDVDKSKKPVTSACYDKQHVCSYLQPFSQYASQYRQNNVFLEGVPLFDALVQGNPLAHGHTILSR